MASTPEQDVKTVGGCLAFIGLIVVLVLLAPALMFLFAVAFKIAVGLVIGALLTLGAFALVFWGIARLSD